MAQNDKGGADLDIFEGLGKKGPPSRSSPGSTTGVRPTPPPPPPLTRPPELKRTLLGVTAPGATPAPPPAPISNAPTTPSRMPPPPSRSSLAAVVGAPPGRPPSIPPPAPTTKPGAAAAGVSIDMDWDDDEDEATHIFDEGGESTHIFDEGDDQTKVAAPMPAAGGAPPAARPKATLLGLTAPSSSLPAPPSGGSRPVTRPPPPPSLSGGLGGSPFGRPMSSGGPSGFPPPPTINPFPVAPPTQPGLGMGFGPPVRSAPPSPSYPAASHSGPMSLPRPAPLPDYAHQPRPMEATALLRPSQNRLGIWVLGAGVVVSIVVVLLVFLMPHPGRILVNVADTRGESVNHLEIFIDGRKQCDTAPCMVDPVSPGQHEVKLFAEGYDAPPVKTVTVESRGDAPANFTLDSSRGTGIKVSGTQAGVKLYVDDRETGPLPQEIRDLTPGDHVIKVAGSERYQPMEKHVTVEKDKLEDLGTVTLKVLKGKVTISLGTPGARVFLASGADRRELPMLPISVDIDTAKAWSLEAIKAGYADYKQPISFDDGQAEKTYSVTLEPRATATPTYYPPAPNYGGSPAPAPAPRPAPQAQQHEAAAPAEGGGEGNEGYLTINSIPPSTCFVDGRSLGNTPKSKVAVKPGTHTVKFVNSDEGLTKTLTVTVGAGETKMAVTKLN